MHRQLRTIGLTAATLLICSPLEAQMAPVRGGTSDSVTLPARVNRSGPVRRFFFGHSYRHVWGTAVTVPVLDLDTFAGGLRPTRAGGGKQTKSLYFQTPSGAGFVFRGVNKDTEWGLPNRFRGTVIAALSRDQVNTSHPAAGLIVAPLVQAAGVLHATPRLYAMPDDARLGEYLEDFRGRLGTVEEFPAGSTNTGAFASARDAISSDTLFPRLNAGTASIDARALLAARLMDMLVNDWDRHAGNWRWALMTGNPEWQPIPRDRDKAFASYSGVIARVAAFLAPHLMRLEGRYPSLKALMFNSGPMDRRILAGLERPVFDSIAAALVVRVTDSVIDHAVLQMPPEYHATAPQLSAILKQRRDLLPEAAARFYANLADIVDIHASDAAERATITPAGGFVDVRIESAAGVPVFQRRFDARETREVRLYLHGGDDSALVTGDDPSPIPVRVIGGNGTNRLVDASRAPDQRSRVRRYDNGQVDRVRYGADTLIDRRPWKREDGRLMPPVRDRGIKWKPVFGLSIDHDLGIVPRFGLSRERYAFGHRPYASRVTLEGEHSMGIDASRISLTAEKRREHSPVFFATALRVSQLEVINFHGFGNASPDTAFGGVTSYAVRQRQYLAHPALAYSLGRRSSLYLGPIVQYSTTDSIPGTLLAQSRPYGFGNFGQAGVRLGLYYDVRDQPRYARSGMLIDASASWYPALWDVQSPFADLSARVAIYRQIRIPLRPILALRGGARKVFGTFPFHQAAFVGGRASAPDLDAQRYAGDAAFFGTAELRLPVAQFSFILPLDIGLFGSLDAARVFVDGDSPGGWHTGTGFGFWIGILDPSAAISVSPIGGRSRTGLIIRTGLNF